MQWANRFCLVLGLGESGLAACAWLAYCGARLRVADSRENPPGLADVMRVAPTAELRCGPFSEDLLTDIDTVVISPGLDPRLALVVAAQARGIQVTGEIALFVGALRELGWRERCKVLAITGTNGKTTTTALTGALCQAAGLDTAVAGNISPAALTVLLERVEARRPPDVWVLELSSFQLETVHALAADAACILNITDDHLDRHGDMASYAAAKAHIFAGCGVQIINRQDPMLATLLVPNVPLWDIGLDAERQNISAEDLSYGLAMFEGEATLVCNGQPLLPASSLRLAGRHNCLNAQAALALCEAIDLPRATLLEALQAFRGLPHRVELFAQRPDDVLFYDDSKGTNVGATLAAIEGLGRRIVLIAGGDGKGQDFSPLSAALRHHVSAVVLIGRDAQRFAEQTANSGVLMRHADSMNAAVWQANLLAKSGEAVLLSPACASMDMFRNYAHRAEVFCAAVLALAGVTPCSSV